MSLLHRLTLLAAAVALALPAAQAGTPATTRARGPGSGADFSTAPRVDVHKPVQLIPLYLRDKRIHGLQPFQELADKAAEGSVSTVPAGRYSGPVREAGVNPAALEVHVHSGKQELLAELGMELGGR